MRSNATTRMSCLVNIVLLRERSFWGKSPTRRFAWWALLLCYCYLGCLFLMLALEDQMLFPGALFSRDWREPTPEMNVQELTLTSADGQSIHAWLSLPDSWQPHQGAVLYSHGNGSNLSKRRGHVRRWRNHLNRAVLIYDYPGYGRSSGRPTERGCLAAAECAFQYVTEELKVPSENLILVGESLGGAMAIDLATRHSVRMLITLSTFTSHPDMAHQLFPWLPGGFLVHNQFLNCEKIAHVTCPVLITHGTADPLIPYWMGEKLFSSAVSPKRFYPRDGATHVPPAESEFFASVKQFLDKTKHR